MDEKDLDKIAEKVALKVGELNSLEAEKLKTELCEALKKVLEAEGKVKFAEGARDEANDKLVLANKAVEDLKKLMPGGSACKSSCFDACGGAHFRSGKAFAFCDG